MTGDSSLFDIPPPRFGRYSVQHQLGVGTTGPVFRGDDPDTHSPVAIKALRTHLPREVNQQVVDDLVHLIDQLPSHPSISRLRAAGLEDDEPYFVSDFIAGESLDVALTNYGPAAIDDVLPRVRAIAEALDLVRGRGLCHGALHPRDVIVTADATAVTGIGVAGILSTSGAGVPIRRPYTAPEIGRGEAPSTSADQFALAAIAFEWLFGKPISGPAYTPLDVPVLPDVNHDALGDAFTIALAADGGNRFPSCVAFVEAVSATVRSRVVPAAVERVVADTPIRKEPVVISLGDDDEEPGLDLPMPPSSAPVSRAPMFATHQAERGHFGLGALAATLVLGIVVGLGVGYFASTRLMPPAGGAGPVNRPAAAETRAGSAPAATPPEAKAATESQVASAPAAPVAASASTPPPAAARSSGAEPSAAIGRLLVTSTPAGATVHVDGEVRGVTPLTLRELELGTRTIVLSRLGFLGEERRVVLTKARPSRTLEVRLSPGASPKTAKPAGDAAASGSLVIDSRPPGAAVTVNGVPRGRTPLIVDALPAGDYTVTMRLETYRPVSITVHVAPGERARAAASLTLASEQE